jgi:hypothetical protein
MMYRMWHGILMSQFTFFINVELHAVKGRFNTYFFEFQRQVRYVLYLMCKTAKAYIFS